MTLHGLTSITLGVPDVEAVASYYEQFGLRPSLVADDGRRRGYATVEGGDQLTIVPAPRRRLLEIAIGADDQDDVGRIAANLDGLGVEFRREAERLQVQDPNSALAVTVALAPRVVQVAAKQEPFNGPGRPDRANRRAPAVERENTVRPRRLGHVVVGSLDQEASQTPPARARCRVRAITSLREGAAVADRGALAPGSSGRTADSRATTYMDATSDEPTQDLHGRTALVPVFDDLNAYVATTHFNGQSTVVLGGERASGESYCLAHHLSVSGDGLRTVMIASLRYLDEFVKQDGVWLFAERRLIVDWMETRTSAA